MISVLIATRNRGPELALQLQALAGLDPPDSGWELIVIDNGSSDGTDVLLGRFARRGVLPLRPLSQPLRGKSRALNLGIRAARGDLLVFTDDDAVADRGWLRGFERAAREYPDCPGFAGRSPAMGAPTPFHRTPGIVDYDHGEVGFLLKAFEMPPPGVNFAFRRDVFVRHGLFREDLGPGSLVQRAEDTEFVRRLWLAGERLRYVPDACLRHPVDLERLRTGYVLRWMYWVGRSNARMTGRPPGIPILFGVPRFLLAALLAGAGGMAMWALSPSKRFARAQRFAFNLGLAYEYWHLAPNFDPATLVPRLAPHAPAPGDRAAGAGPMHPLVNREP
jgi:GT2 family glycosyltransferase